MPKRWLVVGSAAMAAALVVAVAMLTHPGRKPPSTTTPEHVGQASGSPDEAHHARTTAGGLVLPTTYPLATISPDPGSPATRPRLAAYEDYLRTVAPAVGRVRTSPRPLPTEHAASIELPHPALVDARGDLWLTHPDGLPVGERIAAPLPWTQSTHVISTRVCYVHWQRDPRGHWWADVVHETPDGGVQWQAAGAAFVLQRRDYVWDRATVDGRGRHLVPTRSGVAVLHRDGQTLTETHQEVPGARTDVVLVPTSSGVYAFRPWENGLRGSPHVLRWEVTDGRWAAWSPGDEAMSRVVQLFELGDGALLVLSAADDAGLTVSAVPPPRTRPDGPTGQGNADHDTRVRELIDQLDDPRGDVRRSAERELARMGPSAWPVLQAALSQPAPEDGRALTPEAQRVVRRLLGLRLRPSVGVFELFPGPVVVLARGADGSMAVACYGGVRWLESNEEQFRSPALLVVRPGPRAELLDERFLGGGDPIDLRLTLLPDDLLRDDPTRGPLRWIGNHFTPMLPLRHRDYCTWLGVDRSGRWLWRNAGDPTRFLLVDTRRPCPTPRLPAWHIRITGGTTGWDAAGHGVIERGGHAWRLDERGWTPLPPDTPWQREDTSPGAVALQAWAAASGRRGATRPAGVVLAVFKVDERTLLRIEPGRAVRLSRPGPESAWTVDAEFTERIPSDDIRRVWADPFGRICIAHGTSELTVLFPGGVVPPELAPLMTETGPG